MKSVKCSECGFVGWADDSERCKKCGVTRLPNPDGDSGPAKTTYGRDQDSAPGQLRKGGAVASLVLGIMGFFTAGILGVGAIVGISLAVGAMKKAKRNPHEYGGEGVATAGLIMNIISLCMVVPLGIILAIAIPNVFASIRAANESSSIYVLRKIHIAEQSYFSLRGNRSYGTLDELVSSSLLPPELATGVRNGYKFKVELKPYAGTSQPNFSAVAVPVTYGDSGIRSFYVDDSGVVRGGDNRGAEATEDDPPLRLNSRSSTSTSRLNDSNSPDD